MKKDRYKGKIMAAVLLTVLLILSSSLALGIFLTDRLSDKFGNDTGASKETVGTDNSLQ